MSNNTFGERIRLAISMSGKKQSIIAREVGVTDKNVSNWKTNGSMHTNVLLPFAQACGVTTDWLLGSNVHLSPEELVTAQRISDVYYT